MPTTNHIKIPKKEFIGSHLLPGIALGATGSDLVFGTLGTFNNERVP